MWRTIVMSAIPLNGSREARVQKALAASQRQEGKRLRSRSCETLRRQLVSVRRRCHLERVHDAVQHCVVVHTGGQLDEPLRAVLSMESIEGDLFRAICAHELADVGHDRSLFRRKLRWIGLRAQQIDRLFTQAVATRRRYLRRPHIRCFTLAHGGEDADERSLPSTTLSSRKKGTSGN